MSLKIIPGKIQRCKKMFEHKPFKEQLTGYDSENNSYLVSDYPYGFRNIC